jgi:hypothetical protein
MHLFFKCDFRQCFWWGLKALKEWNTDMGSMDMLLDGINAVKR